MTGKTIKRPLHAVAHANNVEQAVPDNAVGIALATVPDKRYADEYISRKISNYEDLELLDYARNNSHNVLLFGPTGPGKTSFVMAWAAASDKAFYSVSSNIAIDPSQLFGKMCPDENGKWMWMDGGVTDIIRHGGVLLLNEINFMPDRIATVLFGLLDKRREISLQDHKGEVIRAHRPECWCKLSPQECEKRWVLIVADMNPDYSGTRPLNFAFRNRFALQIEWGYDSEIEAQLVKSKTLLAIAASARAQIGRHIETPVTTNMLQEFEKIASSLGVDFATQNFAAHFVEDERAAILGVFSSRQKDLEDDFTPDTSTGWNQFEGPNAEWMDDYHVDEAAY